MLEYADAGQSTSRLSNAIKLFGAVHMLTRRDRCLRIVDVDDTLGFGHVLLDPLTQEYIGSFIPDLLRRLQITPLVRSFISADVFLGLRLTNGQVLTNQDLEAVFGGAKAVKQQR